MLQSESMPIISTDPTISILAELPEDLHDELKLFFAKHEQWDYDRAFTCAIAQFLMNQAEGNTRTCAREYLSAWRGGE